MTTREKIAIIKMLTASVPTESDAVSEDCLVYILQVIQGVVSYKLNDFTASEKATIKATWNGKPAILNLIPADPNEDLNNFELYIKG